MQTPSRANNRFSTRFSTRLRTRSSARWPVVAAIIVTSLLATACNRSPTEPTVGQKIDTAIAKTADKTKDLAVTASISANLARDPALSALSINVDTADGRVTLRGKAPDAAAVGRATAIAKATEGVVSVDNQLTVEPRS